jgi:site-specific DNA-methyltransferase (adenine-specific)
MLCESTEQIIWAANGTQKKAKNWTFNYHVLKEMTENKKQMRNMWDIPMTPTSERKFGKHPSQKPLEIGKRLVLGFSNPGDTILDPFAGSGTFLCSAKQNGRKYIGIERELEFIDISKARLKSITA